MLRRTTDEDEETNRAELPMEERRMKEPRGETGRALSWSPPQIYEESIYYSAAMNHGTACGGGGADQRRERKTCCIHSCGRSSRRGSACKSNESEEFTCSNSLRHDNDRRFRPITFSHTSRAAGANVF